MTSLSSQSPHDRILWILSNNDGKMERSKLRASTGMRYAYLNPILEELAPNVRRLDATDLADPIADDAILSGVHKHVRLYVLCYLSGKPQGPYFRVVGFAWSPPTEKQYL